MLKSIAPLAAAAIALAGCDRGPTRVAWDDPAGDVKPLANAPDQPRFDIIRVEAWGSDGALRLLVRLNESLDRFFDYTSPDGKKGGGVVAQFFIDADNNPQTGGHPRWAKDADRPLRGYEYEVSLQLGYRYRQDAAEGTVFGGAFVYIANVTDLQPAARFWPFRLRQGSDSHDLASLKLPPDASEVAQKATTMSNDTIEAAIPYEWLGFKAGDTLRLCFKEPDQGAASGKSFSDDKVLKLGR